MSNQISGKPGDSLPSLPRPVEHESIAWISGTIQNLNDMLKNDNIAQVKMIVTHEKKCVTIDSLDGKQRTIIETIQLPGVESNTVHNSVKLPKRERLETVRRLHMEGKKQSDIAELVCVSQRTVSEDLKTLRKNGEIIG